MIQVISFTGEDAEISEACEKACEEMNEWVGKVLLNQKQIVSTHTNMTTVLTDEHLPWTSYAITLIFDTYA